MMMQGKSTYDQYRLIIMCLLSLYLISDEFHLSLSHSHHPQCHNDERSALLNFKNSFMIEEHASGALPNPYPKTISWKVGENGSDCCSWDGVECDNRTGHVIGLNLAASYLRGTINSTTTLFRLVHLQKLNLSDNDFIHSNIPSSIASLSMLTSIDLSFSVFSGHIPCEISMLSKLSYLCLEDNYFTGQIPLSLANLTRLNYISLSFNNFQRGTLSWLHNLTKLNYLGVEQTNLQGEIPSALTKLTQLSLLNLAGNYFTGQIPSFLPNLTKLEFLDLSANALTGKIPSSMANLTHLIHLSISYNDFTSGTLSCLETLTKLNYFDVEKTNLQGEIPSGLAKFTHLAYLNLADNYFTGETPFFLPNLTKLEFLRLSSNKLTGQIPTWFINLTNFAHLAMTANELEGSIPASVFKLQNLESLYLNENMLNGTVDLDAILTMKHLSQLALGNNNLSVLMSESGTHYNTTLPNFTKLDLSSCNLGVFPDFLRKQENLQWLDLSGNKIQGETPSWIWSISAETLEFINLGGNFLTGQAPVVLRWSNLQVLLLDSNTIHGSIPLPPVSIGYYSLSNNLFSGEIPQSLCRLSSLALLDLSNNSLSGVIPQCLSHLSSLTALALRGNHLNGAIPDKWRNGSQLQMLILGQNELYGEVPISLAKCTMLKVLDLGNNHLNGTFPFWLRALPIKVLILRFNQLHGTLHGCEAASSFSELRVIDLSSNRLIGHLPWDCFLRWKAMKASELDDLGYLEVDITSNVVGSGFRLSYDYGMTLTNKGVLLHYQMVIEILTVIDLSSNRFHGEIPETVATLVGLRTLNFSNNSLTGSIPPSLSSLSQLESLDLSQNELSGQIPQELAQLTFLETFRVSHNRLQGPIPQGNQFSTFPKESYQGNLDLCGALLSKKCGGSEAPTRPPSAEHKDPGLLFDWSWKIVAVGYASGTVAGIVIGHIVTRNKDGWIMTTFGRRHKNKPRLMRVH